MIEETTGNNTVSNQTNNGALDIEVGGFTVRYGTKTVVDAIDITLRPGELVGLVGPNGAGKTSFLRALLGLVPSEGGASVGGRMLAGMTAKERARLFAYLAQGGPIHWPLSVESLVALGRVPHKTPWQKLMQEDTAHIEDAMTATGVQAFRHRLVTHLSGGERARVMLARALAADAPYLLADEPAASLDPHYQLEMMALLRAHIDDSHGGIVVLHDLNLAQHYCDRLVVIDKGRLVADGSPADVLSDRLLSDVFAIRAARWSEGGDSFIVPRGMVPAAAAPEGEAAAKTDEDNAAQKKPGAGKVSGHE